MALRVLILSRNYPSEVMPGLGPWVEGLARALQLGCEVQVVAPVPYCPPLPGWLPQAQFRRIARRERRHGIEVHRPRFATGPGYSTHGIDGYAYHHRVRREVDRIRAEFPFDLIHAHFSYPDGVVAARLGARLRVPVVITEHAPWRPWMDRYPGVRRQAVRAAKECASHVGVSRYVRATIAHFTGAPDRVGVIPLGVDETVFGLSRERDSNLILYVGRIHGTKGVDVLLQAMGRLAMRRPELRLRLVGGGIPFRSYRMEEQRLRALADQLGLGGRVEFVGARPRDEVARLMGESAALVLPSRAESFGAVLVEALAAGTPVVATRCGGPEDIVTPAVGLLTEVEDPAALAAAIDRVLTERSAYAPERLRQYALGNFAWRVVAERYIGLYRSALGAAREPNPREPASIEA